MLMRVIAVCDCGYRSKEYLRGEGFFQGGFQDRQPCICMRCKSVQMKNRLKDGNKCRRCLSTLLFYDEPGLHNQRDVGDELMHFPSKNCLCPSCGKMTMRFVHVTPGEEPMQSERPVEVDLPQRSSFFGESETR
jgi:hypothetical protein